MQLGNPNRQKSLILAAEIQERLKSKVLKLDKKTWIYCDTDQDAIDPREKKEVVEASESSKWAKKVVVNGIVYASVKAYAETQSKSFSHIYRMLKGKKTNTIGIKYKV